MIKDTISAYSIICHLRETTKKEKLNHCENYRIYGTYTHQPLSQTFFAGGEGPCPVIQGRDVHTIPFLHVHRSIQFLLSTHLKQVKNQSIERTDSHTKKQVGWDRVLIESKV